MNHYYQPVLATIKQQFEQAATTYALLFCAKHRFDAKDAFWVNDDIGEVLSTNELFFGLDVIRYDIDNDLPEHILMAWYESNLENSRKEGGIVMNLPSYYKLFGK